jgi:hypothetical protein
MGDMEMQAQFELHRTIHVVTGNAVYNIPSLAEYEAITPS